MKRITIIGGGLAGLTLGIALRHRDVPVSLIEAGDYPRHRVCGEFVSGRGLESLRCLGLLHVIEQAGARVAEDAAFFTHSHMVAKQRLPANALCISRYHLDMSLARVFCEAGGELQTGRRWCGVANEGTMLATGRRRHVTDGGVRWFGIKAHAKGVRLEADLEMHMHRNAYVGICRLPSAEVNVCGLFRQRGRDFGDGDMLMRLRGPEGSVLAMRLEGADFDRGSFCSVAGLGFHREAMEKNSCRVGDAFTMIPPVTGNGMSIAIESAAVALEPLVDYASGRQGWGRTAEQVTRSLTLRFHRRLFWAGLMHRIMFSRFETSGLGLLRIPTVWRAAFSFTR